MTHDENTAARPDDLRPDPRPDHAYIAVAPCGCTYAVSCAPTTVDRRADMARTLAEWVNDGATVEYLTLTVAHERFSGACEHEPRWAGTRSGSGLLASQDDAYRLARDAVRDGLLGDHRDLARALDKAAPDAPEVWWEDVEERLEQALTDALWWMPKPSPEPLHVEREA